jgi:hypothetical protein
VLVECLYQAFAHELHSKIELNDFLAGLSIVSSQQERKPFLRFLFRVYDVRQNGRLERRDVEKLLSFAYGDRFRTSSASISRHLDSLFMLPHTLMEANKEKSGSGSNSTRDSNVNGAHHHYHHHSMPLTVKEFQHFEGRIDVLGTEFE